MRTLPPLPAGLHSLWATVLGMTFVFSSIPSAAGQPFIEFTLQPQSRTVALGQTVVIIAQARALDEGVSVPVRYQWQQLDSAFTWVDIAGATNDAWTHPPIYDCIASPLLYRCAAFAGETVAFSEAASFVLVVDCSPPVIVSVEGTVERQEVIVTFDEMMEFSSATDVFNYQLLEWPGMTPVEIWYATMPGIRTVALHLNSASVLKRDTPYVLKASGIRDLSDPACGCPPLFPVEWHFILNSETCARIIRQPAAQPVSLGCRATFAVQAEWLDGIEHQPHRYQWFQNGFPIWQATQRTFATEPLLPRNTNDSYYVEIYGACETLRSVAVSPILQTNVETLRLHSIRPGQARHSVIISFAPACDGALVPLQEDATAWQNFQWSDGLTNRSAHLDCTGTNIILFTSPPQPGSNYSLTISNIRDQGGHLVENGTFTGSFLAPAPPPPTATGHLQLATAGQLLVLEWADGGTLQTTYQLDAPWQDLPLSVSPLVLKLFAPCADTSFQTFANYYRVRWPAAH